MKQSDSFVGVYLDLETSVILRLFARQSTDASVSRILRKILHKWVKDEGLTIDKVVRMTVDALHKEWDLRDKVAYDGGEDEFLQQQCEELSKKLPEGIVMKITEMYEKDKETTT